MQVDARQTQDNVGVKIFVSRRVRQGRKRRAAADDDDEACQKISILLKIQIFLLSQNPILPKFS